MPPVALRKEGVDRNYLALVSGELRIKSLSARRAWIEITAPVFAWWPGGLVALRKEGVDRNRRPSVSMLPCAMSLSARRAWIEIPSANGNTDWSLRSLSARRAWIEIRIH